MELWKETEPDSLKSYFKIGRYYVAVRLIVLSVCILIIVILLYFYRVRPILTEKFFTKTMPVNCEERFSYSGKVRLTDGENDKVIFSGRLEEGKITGEGTLYDYKGNRVYKGMFEQEEFSGIGTLFFHREILYIRVSLVTASIMAEGKCILRTAIYNMKAIS